MRILTNRIFLSQAVDWGKVEPVTPWMGADTARHYQWYPFINLGHFWLASSGKENVSQRFISYMKKGIDRVYKRGEDNPFLIGIPFIWCSNNLVSAMVTQCHLYTQLSKDSSYAEMEAALRDWLFGCNPWGTSMIIDLPKNGDSPTDPHSSIYIITHREIDGGLVDGPIYGSIFRYLTGLKLFKPDEYAQFQSSLVVYHDDHGDYSSNEPTMDGTAGLVYYLGAMEAQGNRLKNNK